MIWLYLPKLIYTTLLPSSAFSFAIFAIFIYRHNIIPISLIHQSIMMSSYKHHPSSGFFSAFLFAISYWEIMSFGVTKIPSKFYRHKYLGSKYPILSIMLSFAKMTPFYFFFIKSISKSKMDIFILSNLEILKILLKKMCNLHIVTATYFYSILNILTDDIRSCNLLYCIKGFLCAIIGIGIYQHNLIYYFIYNSKTIYK